VNLLDCSKEQPSFFVLSSIDTKAAETYTVDERKVEVAILPSAKVNVGVLELGDKMSYSRAEALPSKIWRTSARKTVYQAMAGTVSRAR
jgi:hypothetical protein